MSYEKYGLTAVDATSSDYDNGIVKGADDKFYKIDNFKHGEDRGLDEDKGKTFGTSLEKDGRKAGFNPSTFNTANDVEGALQAIGVPKQEETPEVKEEKPEEMEMSPEYAHAKARVQQWTDDVTSGRTGKELFGQAPDSTSFLDRYKLHLGERLENGNYRPKEYRAGDSSILDKNSSVLTADEAATNELNRFEKDPREDY